MDSIDARSLSVLRLIQNELNTMSIHDACVLAANESITQLLNDNTKTNDAINEFINSKIRLNLLRAYHTIEEDEIFNEADYQVLFKVLVALTYCWPLNEVYCPEGGNPVPETSKLTCPVSFEALEKNESILYLSGHIVHKESVSQFLRKNDFVNKHLITRDVLTNQEDSFIKACLTADNFPLVHDQKKLETFKKEVESTETRIISIITLSFGLGILAASCILLNPLVGRTAATLIGMLNMMTIAIGSAFCTYRYVTPAARRYARWQQEQRITEFKNNFNKNEKTFSFLNTIKNISSNQSIPASTQLINEKTSCTTANANIPDTDKLALIPCIEKRQNNKKHPRDAWLNRHFPIVTVPLDATISTNNKMGPK